MRRTPPPLDVSPTALNEMGTYMSKAKTDLTDAGTSSSNIHAPGVPHIASALASFCSTHERQYRVTGNSIGFVGEALSAASKTYHQTDAKAARHVQQHYHPHGVSDGHGVVTSRP